MDTQGLYHSGSVCLQFLDKKFYGLERLVTDESAGNHEGVVRSDEVFKLTSLYLTSLQRYTE